MALNIAIAEKDRLDFLYLQQFQTGTAFNNFGAARDSEDHEFFPAYKQSVMAFSLDSFLVHHPECFPSHMKIDVDGNEAKVIDGAKATLMNPRLKSLLIELNEKLPEHVEMAKTIEAFGLKLKKKSRSGTAAMRNSLIVRNYIFEKDEGK
jgi:FkbM family methyltransferase